jgi:tRNA-guanine family transglycosylase
LEVLDALLPELPAQLIRILPGLGSPSEILAAVGSGVDVIASAYPDVLGRAGFALVFDVDPVPQG